jgi:Ca2+-binding EF-hand superfamily protein
MFLDNPDMSKEEVDAIYEQAFIIYDKDNSGLIDKQEVVDYLKEQSFFKEESFGNNLSQNLKSRSASSIIMTTSDQELRFIVD